MFEIKQFKIISAGFSRNYKRRLFISQAKNLTEKMEFNRFQKKHLKFFYPIDVLIINIAKMPSLLSSSEIDRKTNEISTAPSELNLKRNRKVTYRLMLHKIVCLLYN